VAEAMDKTMRNAAEQDAQRPILVVEDNPEQLEMLGILLHNEHYVVGLTADGRQALDWLARRRPALVILDWYLSEMSGSLVAVAIRERYGTQVPILVLSAFAVGTEAMEAGADAFLNKPYHIAELVGTIRRLLAV
jgi:two-component system phosphate regulon response regulator PhoB